MQNKYLNFHFFKTDEKDDRTEEDVSRDFCDMSDEESSDEAENNDEVESQMNLNLSEELNSLGSIMRCGAHSCQIASNRVCEKFSDKIASLRSFVKNSLKLQYVGIFKALGKRPTMDVPTRWTSTYKMLEEIHINKNVYKTIEEPIFFIPNEVWNFLEEFVKVFKPINEGMMFFQKASITCGKFFFLFDIIIILYLFTNTLILKLTFTLVGRLWKVKLDL